MPKKKAKKTLQLVVLAWQGEIDPEALNAAVLSYIRQYDQREMKDRGLKEKEQAERLGMTRQRLSDLHEEVKTVTLPTFVHWCNARHLNAVYLLGQIVNALPEACKKPKEHEPCQKLATQVALS